MADWNKYFTLNNIVALILGIIGLIWLIYGIWRNSKIGKINSWPKTNATIIGAVAQSTSDKNTLVDPAHISIANNSAKYIPKVTYQYHVGNMIYKSNSLVYSGAHSYNAQDTVAIMSKLVPGTVVPIYYNPDNLGESYIYNNITSYTNIIIGLILLLLAGYLAYRHNWSKQRTVTTTTTRKTMDEVSPNFTEYDRSVSRNGTTTTTIRNRSRPTAY